MKSKIVGFLVALLVGATLVWAASYTTGLNLPLTDNSSLNTALQRIDAHLLRVVRDRGYEGQIFCGDLGNATTLYMGPGDAGAVRGTYTDLHIAGTACSALDNATEATADAPLYTNIPLSIQGMHCALSGAVASAVVFTARSAAANLNPSVTCTVAIGATDCYVGAGTSSPPTVAAGATMAVRSVTTTDLSASDAWCEVFYSMKAT